MFHLKLTGSAKDWRPLAKHSGYEYSISPEIWVPISDLTSAEKNYCAYHGEALALVWALKKLRCSLYGRNFVSRTDIAGLCWLLKCEDLTPKMMRWLEQISEFNISTFSDVSKINEVNEAYQPKPFSALRLLNKPT